MYLCTIKIKKKTMKHTLHIYWDDNVTVELRYFDTIEDAEQYVNDNGITSYEID
jgi:hypothetical protein